ncbi:MAG: efflux RND transporter periplasmic adaptor subunit, partial [Pseudomonadales bacterium]|nr:efflux RND transporter periplasmic adaptor subunit [Pseudomonadales bacterium]
MLFKRACVSVFFMSALLLMSGCKQQQSGGGESGQQAEQAIPVRVETPEVRTLTEWNEFTGRFQAYQRVEVRARVSGYLHEVRFKGGEVVNKGDVLFVIDKRPFQIALDGAKARYESAHNEYRRIKKLFKGRLISEEEYDARLQAKRIAKASLDEAKLNLEFTEVKAAITGRVSDQRIDVGNVVNGNLSSNATLLTTIVSISPIEFHFEASETDLLNYIRMRQRGLTQSHRGMGFPVHVKLQDEDAFIHQGTINFTDNELAQDTGTIQLHALFNNDDQLFEPGMFGRMRVAMGAAGEKILVPENVIGTELVHKYVYSLDENNKAIRKYVKLGTLTDDGKQVIREGLTAEDRIIVGGLHMVRPGSL